MSRKNPSSQNTVSIPVAVDTIKSAILQSQYMAASSTNKIQLALYFSVGRFVSLNTRYGRWGGYVYEAWSFAEKESNSAVVTAELANLNEFSQFYGFDAISLKRFSLNKVSTFFRRAGMGFSGMRKVYL